MTAAAKLMSVEDVCEYLGVSRYFVYDQVRLGVLPCARIARQLRFLPTDIDEFVEKHRVGLERIRALVRVDAGSRRTAIG